jgi:hypothetical protein
MAERRVSPQELVDNYNYRFIVSPSTVDRGEGVLEVTVDLTDSTNEVLINGIAVGDIPDDKRDEYDGLYSEVLPGNLEVINGGGYNNPDKAAVYINFVNGYPHQPREMTAMDEAANLFKNQKRRQ